VDFRNVDSAAKARFASHELCHALRVVSFVFEIRLQQQSLRDERYEAVQRKVEPGSVYPGHNLESPEIPAYLLRNLVLLHLYRDLSPILQPCPMYLSYTRACPCSPLHDALSSLSSKAHPKYLLGRFPKVLPYHFLHLLPAILGSVIEHFGEHFLKFWRKDGGLHCNGLPDLEVEPSVGAQKVE